MGRHTGSKFKLSRREGVNLTGTTSQRLQQVIQIPPGPRKKARRRTSEYGVRLRAKQRVKRQYGIRERQFRKFFKRAQRIAGPTGFNLLQLLERRLDNVVYRLGFARTRPMARQLVLHGHVQVNSRRVNVPAYLVKPNDVVELFQSALDIPVVQDELVTREVPVSWLKRQDHRAVITAMPRREDIEPDIREDLVIEFYAR